MTESNKRAFADLRTMDRLAYDLGAEYGSDTLSDASYNADVDVIYCSLFCATDNALREYMDKRSVEGGNCTRKVLTDLGDLMGEDAIISMENDKLSYRWLVDKAAAQIKMANIMYEDKIRGDYQLNWDYEDFRSSGKKKFPFVHNILFNTPNKTVKMGMTLNYLGNDEEWETRTEVSGKYREVSVDEILRRFMAL